MLYFLCTHMKDFNPTAAYKPFKKNQQAGHTASHHFDHEAYFQDLAETTRSIREGNPVRGIPADPAGAEQYLRQETIKSRYNVALELRRRKEHEVRDEDHEHYIASLVNDYHEYLEGSESGVIGKEKFQDADHVPEPDYDILGQSPIYPYEKDLNLTIGQKKEMMKKVVRHLRGRNIFVVFSKTIDDVSADDTKGDYLELNEDGTRDLPIGELMGNKIILNPWNVDFMSTFLTIGHLYGHMVQEMTIEEYAGIREFLAYPKPLDMSIVQAKYAQQYGGRNYKDDFKVFEEEAFAYAKYTFQQAGIEWNETIEHAMRTYIDTDFDELWEWSTQLPEKSAMSFMERFEQYYNDPVRRNVGVLKAKEVGIRVMANDDGNIKVVREGKI